MADPRPIGVESTILDLTVSPPLVRRPGGVTLEQIREVLPDIAHVSEMHGTAAALAGRVGQLCRHYAPNATLTLYVGEIDPVVARVAR